MYNHLRICVKNAISLLNVEKSRRSFLNPKRFAPFNYKSNK
jgi:hypothetical protein